MNPTEQVEVLRASCCVAGADSNCDPAELEILKRLARQVGVGKASFDAMMNRAVSDPNFHKEQFRILKNSPHEAMSILLDVAMADLQVDVQEATVLKNLANNLELTPTDFDQLVQEATKRARNSG